MDMGTVMARALDDQDIISLQTKRVDGNFMSSIRRYSVAVICFWAFTQEALAGDWQRDYGVSVREVYTDNVCLSSDDEQSEFITTVTPSFSVNGSGGRATFNLYGAVEINNLTDSNKCSSVGSNDDNFNPSLNGSGNVELVSNLLYVDGTARIQQNSIDPFQASGDTNLNRNGNRNTTYDYSISPYLTHRFNDVAQVYLRYTYDNQENSESVVGNSDQQLVTASVSGIPGRSKLSWSVLGSYQKISYDEESSTPNQQDELSSVNFNLGYQVNRKWKIFGSVGEEINEFETVSDDNDGDIWSAGFRWTPSPRTDVLISGGQRFFDNTPKVSITHRL
ncbi:TIGR03016 family PEP-CTERM system-associated outer membrane protein, partial [Pseudomaricurvus sp.]|uniref:TIGR03016 family PEP-CTERM system-associated outer membrane protein n=1 Tax=Pseudomaricurvus sp. TaxID=2004510 RepID=UPI003F6B6AB4